ncbi:uncharacterized protein [Antedon mediterranea]|uniref:uncharacterized protein n=1 Tax=Antedon mediterranea TaxID=105859 RepID=UPI003AF4CF79
MAELESLFPPISGPLMPPRQGNFWEDDLKTSQRMELLLNSSLCVISNLSKSRKNRELFRTPEWRKILDIFKGSPSKWRCLYSLIAISYIADPVIDVELLEDKHGVINEITSVLDNTLSGKSTGFSVQELVEALVNLAVHPLNKDQIIEKSVPLLCKMLKNADNEKLVRYVKQVLSDWGVSDVACPSTDEQCQEGYDIQDKSEKTSESDCLDNIQMLDNLYCVLLQCDSFANNDVLDIVTAVKKILAPQHERESVLKHMNEHGWPDILIRIINDVWKAKTETVYTDELKWTIIKTSIEILVNYSDCDPEVLIEHGALNLMHTITDAYYQHFKQKLINLEEQTNKYRGQSITQKSESNTASNNTPTESNTMNKDEEGTEMCKASKVDASHSIDVTSKVVKTEIKASCKTTSSNMDELIGEEKNGVTSKEDETDDQRDVNVTSKEDETDDQRDVNITSKMTETNSNANSRTTEEDVQLSITTKTSKQEHTAAVPYTLKPVRDHGEVNSDGTIAYRINSGVKHNRAVFVSNQPIQTSRLFELKIDKVDDSHNSSMEFGVCIYNSFPDDIFYEGDGFGKGSGFWFLRDNILFCNFETIGGGYKLNLRNIQVDDKVGFVLHPDGTLAFLYNGKYQGIAFRNIPGAVYALVATSGKCVQVSITENIGQIILQESPDTTNDEPFEQFSVKVVGGKSTSLSRLRGPYGLDFINEDKNPNLKNIYRESKAIPMLSSAPKLLNKTNSSVSVYWPAYDVSNDDCGTQRQIDEFVVEYKTTFPRSDFKEAGSVDGSSTEPEFEITNLSPGTFYAIRIKVVKNVSSENDKTMFTYSPNAILGTTRKDAIPMLSAPKLLNKTDSSISVYWPAYDVSNDDCGTERQIDEFVVEYKTTVPRSEFTEAGSVDERSTKPEFEITNLSPGTLYAIRIKVVKNVSSEKGKTMFTYSHQAKVETTRKGGRSSKTGYRMKSVRWSDRFLTEAFKKAENSSAEYDEINQRSRKGYLNEIDIKTVIKRSVSLYKIHSDPATRVDPISNEHVAFITTILRIQSEMLAKFQKHSTPPENTNTLPKRFQQVFELMRPCFDNIKDMSGIVWTGSTSEGFAISDNSGPGMSYVDDEMDLMIPLAIAAEDPHNTTCEEFTIANDVPRGMMEEKEDVHKKSFITEMEDIGNRQQRQECPTFTWRPSVHSGYVTIFIPESLQSYTSLGFTKHLCARSSSGEMLLTRSKLLGIQEQYTRGRLKAVQSEFTRNENNKVDEFKGKLRLVQEGPVQTISVCYESQEPFGSVLQFDQTVDVAIALNGVNWPTIANSWVSRQRKWPQKTTVEKIIADGYHIVPKYYPGGKGLDLEWRLSFSVAERTLAHTFTDQQRKCYMIFKLLWRRHFKEPKVLSSYHMKTTMFWLCERTSPTDWIDSNLGDRFLDLQNFLIHFLQKRNLPNYFIPENNMISNIDAGDVKVILVKVQNVRRQQIYSLSNLVTPSTFFFSY